MNWYPHVTVATVIEKQEKFLLVKEESDGLTVFNQPAGHLEEGESILDAAVRETLEETGWDVEIHYLLGINQYLSPTNNLTYIRFSFAASPIAFHPDQKLDNGIIYADWFSVASIQDFKASLRSPMVLSDIQRFLAGHKYPLEVISSLSF